jgi:disulfide bond formation protein DsbB
LCIFQRLLYLLLALLALCGVLLPALGARLERAAWLDRSRWAGDRCLPELAAVSAGGEQGVRFWRADADRAHRRLVWRALAVELFMATGFCSSKDWVFLGLSMANWSCLCFPGLSGRCRNVAGQVRRALERS